MTVTDERLAPLRSMYPGCKVFNDGGQHYVFIPQLPITVDGICRNIDALLCPAQHTGYSTRLFLEEPIAERPMIGTQAANWSTHNILGRQWHSWSWQGVSESLPLPQMLLAHVSALR